MVPVGPKTTMRIGGNARFYAELKSKTDLEETVKFSQEKGLPLIILGGGSNTIFSDETIDAVVARIGATETSVDGNFVRVQSGKNLPMLINELAKQNLDLSPLTGILGTVGGAIYGNAGQGPTGTWIDHYVREVNVFLDNEWKTFTRDECAFDYRESAFKHMDKPPIIWEVLLEIPSRPQAEIEDEVKKLLQRRIETQPHVKTAGSCFKAHAGTPAWQLIDKQGLRGMKIGDVQIAEKHANFLLNTGKASYQDAVKIVEAVKEKLPDLEVEMRFIEPSGKPKF